MAEQEPFEQQITPGDRDRFAAIPPVEYPPHNSTGIEVMGRGWKSPRVRVVVLGERFVLQIDDHQNQELWMYVYINEDIVSQWARFSALRTDIE